MNFHKNKKSEIFIILMIFNLEPSEQLEVMSKEAFPITVAILCRVRRIH